MVRLLSAPIVLIEMLIRYSGFGTRRVPLETHYFEAYNHDNVRLVDVKNEDPIERITKNGILLRSGEHVELDVLIYATGFDAITGAFSAIDFRGEGGVKLTDVWSEGPRTFLGLFVHQFPNSMFPRPGRPFPRVGGSRLLDRDPLSYLQCSSYANCVTSCFISDDDYGASPNVWKLSTKHRVLCSVDDKIHRLLHTEQHYVCRRSARKGRGVDAARV